MDSMDLCSEFFFINMQIGTNRGYKVCVISQLWPVSRDDFVLLKLKKEAAEEGVFLVRWSALNYHCIILAVLNKSEVSQPPHCSLGIIAVQSWSKTKSKFSLATCLPVPTLCVFVACRIDQHQATSSFGFGTSIQCSVWRDGIENSPA